MSNRHHRALIAQETLHILSTGHYTAPSGAVINVAASVERTLSESILYTPDDFAEMTTGEGNQTFQVPDRTTTFQVINATTLNAARRAVGSGERVLALNFASAKNPGGGFLSGSQAQEESLARASGLYRSIAPLSRMYNTNRHCGTCLYTDHMIYWPDVPVFRDDEDQLLEVV